MWKLIYFTFLSIFIIFACMPRHYKDVFHSQEFPATFADISLAINFSASDTEHWNVIEIPNASVGVSSRITRRLQQLRRGCSKYGFTDLTGNWTWHTTRDGKMFFFIDRDHKHRVCEVPKAGSTTWFWYSSFLRHHSEVIESREEINILPVRHPFLRLVSAY
ncbi:unnamed protein product, partial [Meganyctiphanes norvegica]